MHIKDVIAAIEEIAPQSGASSWDKSGIQVAAVRDDIQRLGVALDPDEQSVGQALNWGADFVLTHHPLALTPVFPERVDAYHRVLTMLLSHGVWLYAAHTSLDVQPRGPVQWLARELGLENVDVLHSTGCGKLHWFRVLGPETAVASLATALKSEEELEIYGAAPQVLELVCSERLVPRVRAEVLHGASNCLRVLSGEVDLHSEQVGFGFVGFMPEPMNWEVLASRLKKILGSSVLALAGPEPGIVRRLACCPGSGGSMVLAAAQAGAEVFVTGDLKYHDARRAEELGILVVDAGHFVLEERMMRILAAQLVEKLGHAGVTVEFFPGRDVMHRL